MDADTALTELRAARVRLFDACRKRDALLITRPFNPTKIDAANEQISLARADVENARAAAEGALTKPEGE